jgi:acetyltransferase
MEIGMIAPKYCWQHEVDGFDVTIRTLLPEDHEIESAFVRNLSSESRYFRFHGALRELTPEMLHRFTHMDFPLQMALIASIAESSREKQIGVARYVTATIDEPAEIAVVVADEWQRRGIATLLLTHLREVAIEAGIKDLYASVLAGNSRMLSLVQHLGFKTQTGLGDFRLRQLGKSIRKDEPGK